MNGHGFGKISKYYCHAFLSKTKFISFFLIGLRVRSPVSRDRLSFRIKSITLLNQSIPIHKNQYYFEKRLGNGFFGEVYSAHRLPDSKYVFYFHI